MLNFLQKNKLIFTIGDDGVVVSLFKKGRLKDRIFAASLNSPEALAIQELSEREKGTPLYVLVDILDQSYVQHLIPPVSSFTINSLIKRKLDKDFAPGDIKAAMRLGRAQKGRKDWNYMFVSVHNVPPFSEWIEMALELPNRFVGIYMLPIEAELTIRDLDKAVEGQKREKNAVWKILITHNRVGGVRQIVFRNYKLVLTRMNQPISSSAADVIAGNIEQDLSNTLEFIRRMGFDEKDGFDLFILSSAEVKSHLEMSKVSANGIFLLTPFEAATRMHLANAAEETDKYSDVVLAANFAGKEKHILKLGTAYGNKLQQLYLLKNLIKITTAVFFLGVFIFSAYMVISYITTSKEIRVAEEAKREKNEKLKGIKEEAQAFPVEIGKVLDTMDLNARLIEGKTKILDLLTKFSSAKVPNSLVREVNVKNIDSITEAKTAPTKISATFNIEMAGTEKRIEQVIESTNMMVANVKAMFADYDIKFNNLPGGGAINTSIDKQTTGKSIITFSVNIDGPKAAKIVAPPTAPAVPAAPETPGGQAAP